MTVSSVKILFYQESILNMDEAFELFQLNFSIQFYNIQVTIKVITIMVT